MACARSLLTAMSVLERIVHESALPSINVVIGQLRAHGMRPYKPPALGRRHSVDDDIQRHHAQPAGYPRSSSSSTDPNSSMALVVYGSK